MSDITVFSPATIPDSPFPQSTVVDQTATVSSRNGIYSPSTIQDQPAPVKPIAKELLSTALNTRSKKILQEFQFTKQGALQIGEYQNGVSGDIRISKTGIVTRNSAGQTTVAIDGDTGDALFAGELRSGSTITGSVEILSGGYLLMADSNNIPAIFLGELA